MALRSNETATFFAQKKLLGKAHTSNLSTDAGEQIGSAVQLSSKTIFGQDIPENPSQNLYQLQGVSGTNTVEYVEFDLVGLAAGFYDATDAGGGGGSESSGAESESSQGAGYHAYAFRFKSSYETDSSNPKKGDGNFDNSKLLHETLGAVQLVPPSFSGQATNPYIIKVFASNGASIGELSVIDWQVDTYNGIMFVQDAYTNTNLIPATAKAFIYVGDMLDSVVSSGGGGGSSSAFFNETGDGFINTTGSVSFAGGEGTSHATTTVGSDTFFFVSGSLDGSNRSVFGGDVVTSGSLISDNMTGSLTKLSDGTSYILSNGSISVTTQSNGSILLSAANSVFNEYIGEADGSNTRFTLDYAPTANKNVSVFVNGQLQMPATDITGAPFQDYSVTGSVILFVTASLPPEGSLLMANYTTNQSIS